MLVDNKFIFLAIPRCATVSFEKACLENKFELDYNPYILITKEVKNGLTPSFHSHTRYRDYKKIYGNKYPIITITRNPVDRFISGWKYILLELQRSDRKLYDTICQLSNEDFMHLFLKHFKNLQFDKKTIKEFFSEFGNDFRLTRNLMSKFQTVLLDPYYWTNDANDILYFNFENQIPEIESWVSNTCGVDFKMERTNDTKNVILNLQKNDEFIDFYHNQLYQKFPQKSLITVI